MTLSNVIDWVLVKKELLKKERIKLHGEPGHNEALYSAFETHLEKAKAVVRPKSVRVIKKICSLAPGSIQIDGGVSFSSRHLSGHIKGANRLCIFLVTIGDALENEASRLMHNGDHLGGYMLDRIGSFSVESMAENAEKEIREFFKSRGESVSMSFSPGYCDWLVEEQRLLAGELDFSKAGVRLTEKCMMIPKKSISAVVAIGAKALFAKINSPCALCNKVKDCYYSRV